MKRIILIIIAMLSTPALACEETSLVLNLASHHSGDGEFNEKNYGMGGACKYKGLTYSAGFYDNSYDKTSYYGGVGIETSGTYRAGLSLLAVSGYKDFVESASRVSLVPLPELSANYGRYKIMLGYLPGIDDGPSVTTLRAGIILGGK